MMNRWFGVAVVALCSLSVITAAHGQSIRITGVTSFQYLDVRALGDDSIPSLDAQGSGLLRVSPEGFVVRCVEGDAFCRYRRTTTSSSTIPAIQDLTVNAWGFARGVRFHGRLRGRGMVVGDESLWPRADDLVDVQAAYVEVNRTRVQGRVGRLWKTSGLGYHNFDGASVAVQPLRRLTIEAYGGWSLARGIHESRTSGDLAAIEPLAPDDRAYLIGAEFAARLPSGSSLGAHYQREIRSDRLGLYSERVAVDAVVRAGFTTVDAALKYDMATRQLNETRVRFWLPTFSSISINGYARHHRPFFELWTIWGAFSPLGFDEAGVNASWRQPNSPLTIDLWTGARRYDATDTDTLFGNFRRNGWRVGTTIGYQFSQAWYFIGQYRADIGFGAARSDGNVRLQRGFGNGNTIGINASAFQRLYEFRVDESTTLGFGADVSLRGGNRTQFIGSATAYRHTSPSSTPTGDWTQLRGSLRFVWTVGVEPGISRRTTRLP